MRSETRWITATPDFMHVDTTISRSLSPRPGEPPRVLKKSHDLRDCSDENSEHILLRAPGACFTHGRGAPAELNLHLGGGGIESPAPRFGCVPQTLYEWINPRQIAAAERPETATEKAEPLRAVVRGNTELRRANKTVRVASAFSPGRSSTAN